MAVVAVLAEVMVDMVALAVLKVFILLFSFLDLIQSICISFIQFEFHRKYSKHSNRLNEEIQMSKI